MSARRLLAAALLAVPGPCTVFDGVSLPPDDAGDATDGGATDVAAEASACPSGVRFDFEGDAGGCQELADENCCIFEAQCGGDPSCAAWIACVNACSRPRSTACVNQCGSTKDFAKPLADLGDCRAAFDGAARCVWP